MIILTAGHSPKNAPKEANKKFSFKSVIEKTVENSHKFGYKPVVYDLGNLGIGEPYSVQDDNFTNEGFYKEVKKGYQSKSLFKPEIVEDCLKKHQDFTVYVDGDAVLHDKIDEVVSDDYDIGVTLRRPSELQGAWYDEYSDIAKFLNAGVIFFNPTPATLKFVEMWKHKTYEVENDQKALNLLACEDDYPEINSISVINGVRIKYFPGDQYNYYYFNEGLVPNIKIMHFKGNVRNFYPFDFLKNAYCKLVAPVEYKIRSLFN
ncbi:MAG: hypothetical protein ACJAS1_003482 [Oleiphilaceae bacterium]|jgi:hypothetical protein